VLAFHIRWDKQHDSSKALIEAQVELLLMHEKNGFDDLVLKVPPRRSWSGSQSSSTGLSISKASTLSRCRVI